MRIRLLARWRLAPVLLAVVGCSKDNADVTTGSNPEGVTVAALDGKTFVSTDGDRSHVGAGLVRSPSRSRMARYGPTPGCNSIGGNYTITNSILNGGDNFSSTLMGCDGDLCRPGHWLGRSSVPRPA